VSQRLLEAVNGIPIETAAGPLRITVSVGLAHRTAADTELGELLDRADQALYQAKQDGRDRISIA
jgi:diguanylate cyclase (GGDEF)-like protein